jgi:membrane-associated protease RseP (regulator of RpoE activity)
MQEVKNNLKKIGEKMRGSNDTHKESLRKKLIGLYPEGPVTLPGRPFWSPVFSWGAVAVMALVIGGAVYDRPVTILKSEQSVTAYEAADFFVEDASFIGRISIPRGEIDVTKDVDIIEYEEDHGTMLEQSVNIRMLTREEDASKTVAALFTSLGGHLSSIRSRDDEYTAIKGSIPTSQIIFFYEQLDMFVKNDAFIEKTLRGDSVTSEAIDLAGRIQLLRDDEARITEQLQNATTDVQKKMLQEGLETISAEMIQLIDEQDALDDRIDYVTVSVNIEKLPSIWDVQNKHQLNDVIAGYESPTLWQGIVINVLTVFFIAIEFLSVTFWILIPLGIFILMHLRRRRVLHELE